MLWIHIPFTSESCLSFFGSLTNGTFEVSFTRFFFSICLHVGLSLLHSLKAFYCLAIRLTWAPSVWYLVVPFLHCKWWKNKISGELKDYENIKDVIQISLIKIFWSMYDGNFEPNPSWCTHWGFQLMKEADKKNVMQIMVYFNSFWDDTAPCSRTR